jgi:hypothetical protein
VIKKVCVANALLIISHNANFLLAVSRQMLRKLTTEHLKNSSSLYKRGRFKEN